MSLIVKKSKEPNYNGEALFEVFDGETLVATISKYAPSNRYGMRQKTKEWIYEMKTPNAHRRNPYRVTYRTKQKAISEVEWQLNNERKNAIEAQSVISA